MTFDEWYKVNIEPKILIPPGVTEQQAQMLRSTARRSMAACWNAATDAAQDAVNAWADMDAACNLEALKVKA